MIWNNPPKFVPVAAKSSKLITPEALAKSGSEDGEQAALFCWAAQNTEQYPQLKWLFAIPNGGQRHIAEATKLVATGTRAGVPDICFPCPTNGVRENHYHGLWIEMKIEKHRTKKNGGCSEEQLGWHEYLRNAGYYVAVCYSWIEGRDCLISYLEGKL